MKLRTTYPFFILLFILGISDNCFAKDKTDSLKQVIQTQNKYPERIKAFIELVYVLQLKKTSEALVIAENGLKEAVENKDSTSIGHLLQLKGTVLYFRGLYDSAAYYYYKATTIFERIKNNERLAWTYNEIGRLFRKTRDLKKSLQYYDRALNIFKLLEHKEGQAVIYNESGVVFEYNGDYNEAIRRYTASLHIQKQRNDSVGIGYCYNFLAGVYLLKKDFKLAEKYNLDALHIRQQLNDSFSIALSYSDLGTMYETQKLYAKAIESFTKSNTIAASIGYIELQLNNYRELANIAKEQGNYEQAFLFTEKYTAFKDSIYKIEKVKQIEDISEKYETEKKEQQITLQQTQLIKRNILIASITGILLLTVLLGISFYRRYRLKQQARLHAEILNQQELSIKAVLEAEENERKRIASDLHDGVGQMMSAAKMNLSAIENDIQFNSPDLKVAYNRVVALVDESCREVRTVSHNMMPNVLLKAGLALAVKEFLDKIDSRVIKINLYTQALDERIDTNVETVLYRIIQECVNNVIKHAKASHLDISLIKDEDGISATIEDNGKGFNTSDKTNLNGIGLKNIQSRVSYLKGTVEWNSGIGKGTLVAIHVPLSK